MPISNLIFLSNELMDARVRNDMRLPLHFVTFAIIEAQLYSNVRNEGVVNVRQERKYKGNVAYGALFHLEDFHFHIRQLDAFHMCSLSALGRNHDLDTQHRIITDTTPIVFSSIDALERLQYEEKRVTKATAYIGNLKHPKLNRRIRNTNSKRIKQNILVEPFLHLHREVTN